MALFSTRLKIKKKREHLRIPINLKENSKKRSDVYILYTCHDMKTWRKRERERKRERRGREKREREGERDREREKREGDRGGRGRER